MSALGREAEAATAFKASAAESGDFAEMAVAAHSPLSYFRGLSLRELGRGEEADALFHALLEHGNAQLDKAAMIDYFATSLPNLLVFDECLQTRRDAEAYLLIALAWYGIGNPDATTEDIGRVLAFDSANLFAVSILNELEGWGITS